MGFFANLQKSFALALFPSQFVAWIDAVSAFLDGSSSGFQANTRYVSLDGNDTTGDGTFAKPYLTVAKAMSTITAATPSNPWIAQCGPGFFPDPFTIKNGVYVIGSGSGGGMYNGAPQVGVTVIAPTAAQVLDASWAGAGTKAGGILNCALSTVLKTDFAAIGNTSGGACSFLLKDVSTNFDITAIGNAASLAELTIQNVYANATATYTFTDMASVSLRDLQDDYGCTIAFSQAAALQGFHLIQGCSAAIFSAIWTSALQANFMSIICEGFFQSTNPTVTGTGALVIINGQSITLPMSDAANRLAFGNEATATMIGVGQSTNIITGTPTANRLLTIDRPPSLPGITTIIVKNLSTAFNIDLSFPAGTIEAGSPTYVPPLGQVEIIYDFVGAGDERWYVKPYVQRGKTTLVAGRQPGSPTVLPLDITAISSVVTAYETVNGGVTGVNCSCQARTVGTRAGGGGITLEAIDINDNTVITDVSTINYQVA